MKELTEDQVREFVRDLSKLSRKHKICIGGCGCCGSPYLIQLGKDDGRYEVTKDFDRLSWKSSSET